jgi:hypothetical protein
MFAAPISRWVLSMVLAVLMSGWLCGAEAELKDEVAKLFAAGWQPSLKARAACSDQFARLEKMAPADRRIPYAYALVHIRQRSYPYAAKPLCEVRGKEPKNAHAGRGKIWTQMIDIYPGYAMYRRKAGRDIKVFAVRPEDDSATLIS